MDIEKKDEQPLRSTPVDHSGKRNRRRRCIIICSSIIAVILLIALILLILALTVFKAKKPVLTVNSVALQDLDFAIINPIPIRVSLNLSLALGIAINNPNKVGVKYRSSFASVRYKHNEVGQVPIPAGEIGSDETKQLNLTLTVFADRLISDSNIYGDIISGNLPFTTYAKIYGKVRVLFVHIKVTSTSTCDVNIDVPNRRIANQTCHYQNKI